MTVQIQVILEAALVTRLIKIFAHRAALFACLIICLGVQSAHSQVEPWAIDGPTSFYKVFDNKLWISRKFGSLSGAPKGTGPQLGALALYDVNSRTFNISKYPRISGQVIGAHFDSQGRLYVFGRFALVDADRRIYYDMVRFLPNGEPDPSFLYYAAGSILATASDGVQIYVVGSFRAIADGRTFNWAYCRQNGFAIDLNSGEFTDWSPESPGSGYDCQGGGDGGTITDLAVAEDSIYVAGFFSRLRGKSRQGLAEVDKASGMLTAFAPSASIESLNYSKDINSLAVSSSKVYLAGVFEKVGGVSRPGVARFDRNTGALDDYVPPFQTRNPFLYLFGESLYISTSSVPGGLAKVFEATGALDSSFQLAGSGGGNSPIAFDESTRSLVTQNGTFSATSGAKVSDNPKIGGVGTYGVERYGQVTFAGSNGSKVLFTGEPSLIEIKADRPRFVEIDLSTGMATNFAYPDSNDSGGPFDVTSSNIFFSTVHGDVSKFDFVTKIDNDLLYLQNSGNPVVVKTVQASGNVLTVAGKFTNGTTAGAGQNFTRKNLIAFNHSTNTVLPLNITVDGEISDFQQSGSTLFIIGSFNTVNGQARRQIAAVDFNTGALLPFNPTINSSVLNSILVDSGTLYVAGNFSSVNGYLRKNVAAFDIASGTLLPFSASSYSMTAGNIDARVTALAKLNQVLYIGIAYPDPYQPSIIAVDSISGAEIPFNTLASYGGPTSPEFLAVASSTPGGEKNLLLFGGSGVSDGYDHVYGGGRAGIYSISPSSGVVVTSTTPLAEPTRRATTTPQPTNTAGPTRTPWPTPTSAIPPTPTPSLSPTATHSPTVTATSTNTATLTSTNTPQNTASPDPSPTVIATPSPVPSANPAYTPTRSAPTEPTITIPALVKYGKVSYKLIKGRYNLVFPSTAKNLTKRVTLVRVAGSKKTVKLIKGSNWAITLKPGKWNVSFDVIDQEQRLVGMGTAATLKVKG